MLSQSKKLLEANIEKRGQLFSWGFQRGIGLSNTSMSEFNFQYHEFSQFLLFKSPVCSTLLQPYQTSSVLCKN